MSLTFADEGLEVETVGDGDEAVRHLEESEPPDIVLADVFMPGLDGYQLCERIKNDPRLRHIPVVLLIGTFEPFSVMEARRVGADDVLTKPFQSIRGLVNKVGSLLGGSDSKKETEATDAPEPQGLKVEDDFSEVGALGRSAPAISPSHADAPAAEPAPVTRDEATPFGDFADDDLLIEATPADSYGATAAAERPDSPPVTEAPDAVARFDFWNESEERERREPAAELAYEQQQEAARDEAEHVPHEAHEEEEALPVYAAPVEATFEENVAAQASATESFTGESFISAEREEPAAPPVYAARAAYAGGGSADSSSAADDALLDLDDLEPAPMAKAVDEDDFILDLDEDLFAPAAREAEPAYSAQVDAAGAFAEAAHGEPFEYTSATALASVIDTEEDMPPAWATGDAGRAEQEDASATGDVLSMDDAAVETPQSFYVPALSHEEEEMTLPHAPIEPSVVPADEPVPASVESEFTDGSVEGDVAKPPALFDEGHTPASFDEGRAAAFDDAPIEAEAATTAYQSLAEPSSPTPAPVESAAQQIGLDQLSPEAIDAIARRAVELLSERIVRDVAWEVVPDLAERLIRRRLDEK